MRERKLNITKTPFTPLFDIYSSLDTSIVSHARHCGFALTGGTAVQVLARYYDVKERRARSINDLDFITAGRNAGGIRMFAYFLEKLGFVSLLDDEPEYMMLYVNSEEGVDVDCLISWEQEIEDLYIFVGPYFIINPCYIFKGKVQRLFSKFAKKQETDIQDLNTLYDVIKKRGEIELLEAMLSKADTDFDPVKLNEFLQE